MWSRWADNEERIFRWTAIGFKGVMIEYIVVKVGGE
jgi:hypothetical protein